MSNEQWQQIEAAQWVVDRLESRPSPQQIPISIQIGRFKRSLTCSFVAIGVAPSEETAKYSIGVEPTKGALMVEGLPYQGLDERGP